MQFLVPYNYKQIVVGVGPGPFGDWISVYDHGDECSWQNYRYGGAIDINDCNKEEGHFSYFRTPPGYRSNEMDSWSWTKEGDTLLVYLTLDDAFIVMENNEPVVISKKSNLLDSDLYGAA